MLFNAYYAQNYAGIIGASLLPIMPSYYAGKFGASLLSIFINYVLKCFHMKIIVYTK